jgi:2-polyprenyl-3-methyl-5-hydroxy-6-metoxy-1,4-benzoquinol methylase
MVQYTSCPVCGGTSFTNLFAVTDTTVSKQSFTIIKCTQCTIALTQNAPNAQNIGPYYNAEAYVSHTNSTKGFINTIYHWVRRYSLRTKVQLIKTVTGLQTGTLLDVGCGTGAFLHQAKTAGWQVTGLEPDATARQNAQQLFGITPNYPQQLFNFAPNTFNAITMWHVLEHVHTLNEYLQQLHKILTPNGKLVIAVPNYTSADAAAYKNHWAGYDVPRHLYHFSPQSMQTLLAKHGFTISQYKPMWFDSFYVSLLSEKNKSGNIASAFINGLLSNIKALGNVKKCSSVIYIAKKNSA